MIMKELLLHIAEYRNVVGVRKGPGGGGNKDGRRSKYDQNMLYEICKS